MMDILIAVRLMRFAFGLLMVWAFFYIWLRSFFLDNLRQALFEIRDNLFDFAADGAIPFDDFCYRILRDDLNGLILFADKMSFLRIFLTPLPENAFLREQEWLEHTTKLQPAVRRTLLSMRERALYRAMAYVIQRSVVLLVLTSIIRFAALWIDAAQAFSDKLRSLAKRLEAQALDEYRSAA